MKLFSLNLSHYAARVRIALALKGLAVEIVPPPRGGLEESLRAPEYVKLNPNPLGRVPCLVTDDGDYVAESGVILEYLEDAFPAPALLPASPVDRAKVRLAARTGEFYVAAPMQFLLFQTDPARRDAAVVAANLDRMEMGLGYLERLLDGGPFAVGDSMTLADCVLPTMLRIAPDFARVFDRPTLVSKAPRAMAYLAAVREHPAVAKVFAEMAQASATYRATGVMT